MINKDIWNKAYKEDYLEVKEDIKENEQILLIPIRIKTDEHGVIVENRTGNTLDYYKKEINKLEVERMIKECNNK